MFFDTHCHLDDKQFDADREEMFARAIANGVTRFVNISYDLDSSRRSIALATVRPDVYAAIGIHPNDANHADAGAYDALRGLATHPRVVAIGEIGLDYYWDAAPREVQREVFERQLDLAQDVGKPIIIHCRDKAQSYAAYDDVLAILFARDGLRGRVLLHAYAGSFAQAEAAIRHNYTLGFGGPISYPKSENTREIAAWAPEPNFVLETDAPYLPPQKLRGKRNEPGYIPLFAATLAKVRGMELAALADLTTHNALSFLGITSK